MHKNFSNIKRGLVIADTGPIISLAVIKKLELLDALFGEVLIPFAVWEELQQSIKTSEFHIIEKYFKTKVRKINSINNLTFIMDYGESESVILYKELNARFLLIDDKKARKIAENFQVECIGTIGILIAAKKSGQIKKLKPNFVTLLKNKRYFSKSLLNRILADNHEGSLK